MNVLHKSALALLLAATYALPAAAAEDSQNKPAPSKDDCVFFHTVFDWRSLDDTNIVIWAPNRRHPYLLRLSAPLTSLRFNQTLGFFDGDRDGRLCAHGLDAVTIAERGFPQKVSIYSMSELDAGEVTALEEKYKVELTRDKDKKKIPEPPQKTAAE